MTVQTRKTPRFDVAAGGLLALLLGFCAVAQAQQPAPGKTGPGTSAAAAATPAPRRARTGADRYADLATVAYRAGDYKVALRQFLNAYRTEPRALFLYNMARCQEKLGRYTKAIKGLRDYLDFYRRTHPGMTPPNQNSVLAIMNGLRRKSSERRARVVVGSNPPGATVVRVDDGAALGITPLELRLRPGIYKLRLELAEHMPLDADLEVPETAKVRAVFTLQPIRLRAAISVWINVRRAKIEIDGETVAVSPHDHRFRVGPGRHVVRITKVGYQPIEEIVELPLNRLLEIRYVMQPRESLATWRFWVGWPTLAVGLGGMGGGVAAGMQADHYYRDSANFERFSALQNVGYGLGGLGAGVGLGLVLWDAFRSSVADHELVAGRARKAGRKLKPLLHGAPQ